jgi:hypothetical protein
MAFTIEVTSIIGIGWFTQATFVFLQTVEVLALIFYRWSGITH